LISLTLDDVRQLNEKLAEASSSKMGLQIKVDELEAAEVNIKVGHPQRHWFIM
jgi:hypothetical protein